MPALVVTTATTMAMVSGLPSVRAADNPSSAAGKGAQVYCFMRNSGNNHEVSWLAAYALIKRQSASLFKTSPEHAAVMITEAVVQNPGSFPDCGRYLGDLYASAAQEQQQKQQEREATSGSSNEGGATRSERYAY
ncbi:penicillin amidase [Synechococcus sp. CB0101]|nr:penicillin amidase [Synechococcus sp. CB0101]